MMIIDGYLEWTKLREVGPDGTLEVGGDGFNGKGIFAPNLVLLLLSGVETGNDAGGF